MAADIAGARKTPWLLLSPSLATISLLLIVPMLFIVVYSFWLRTATGADQVGFYLDNWIEVLGDRCYRDILFQTLLIAFLDQLHHPHHVMDQHSGHIWRAKYAADVDWHYR